jgi:hypothetical protein
VHLSLVFHVFLARMAVGTLASLVPLWSLRAAERHLRFQCLLALVLAAGAAALLASAGGGVPIPLVAVAVLAGVVNFLFGTFRRGAGRAVLVLALLVGVVAVLDTARLSTASTAPPVLAGLTLGGLLGGLLMGSVNDAMILGHFYLMIRGLPLEALRRAGKFTAGAILARIAYFGLVLLVWGGAAHTLLEREVFWTSWRIAFGFVGPLVLLWMVKDTVRLKHTQAATGLLYIAIGFALLGELSATFLELQTGIPT